jgi:microcystin-dependent protein
MSDPFLSEIRIMSFNFPPKGWALCNGQLLPINQNQALFSLLNNIYGGDGRTTFALPNLQGKVPIHVGNTHVLAETGGEYAHTLTPSELAAHTHAANASSLDGDKPDPADNVLAGTATTQLYSSAAKNITALAPAVSSVGGSQPHENTQPYLTLSFCIALQGIFPSEN